MYFLIIPIALFLTISSLVYLILSHGHLEQKKSLEEQRSEVDSTNSGCLLILASLLLRPIPIIFVFYLFGFQSAVTVALVMWPFVIIYRLYKRDLGNNDTLLKANWILLPIGACLTLYLNDKIYFQLIPTFLCLLFVVEHIFGVIKNIHFMKPFHDGTNFLSNQENKLLRLGFICGGILGIFISEFIRQNSSLTTWIWYYGYLRIELVLIALVTAAPVLMKRVERQ